MPGASASTPVVSQGRVFVSTADKGNDSLLAMCLDRESGKILWQHTIAKGIAQDTRSNYASPSPASDGQRVVFFYGNGDLVTFTHEGQQLWKKNIGPFAFMWTFSSSPLLYEDKLYMQILQRDVRVNDRGSPGENQSYLLALDPQTGRERFRSIRSSDAVAESLEAFTTPVPHEYQGRKELLIAGGDAFTGHDPETGSELWRWETWNPTRIGHWRLVPSPVAGNGIILACAPKKDPIYAIRAGGSGRLSDAESLAWVSREQREISSDVPTPAFYDGDFFVLSDERRALVRVEPQTGRVKWNVRIPGRRKYEASPLAADGKIYVMDFDGAVTIVNAQDGSIVRTVPMEPTLETEDLVRSSIIASDGQLFIRTNTQLYCIGK
jgi:outer membrane protein assembly factor BamB